MDDKCKTNDLRVSVHCTLNRNDKKKIQQSKIIFCWKREKKPETFHFENERSQWKTFRIKNRLRLRWQRFRQTDARNVSSCVGVCAFCLFALSKHLFYLSKICEFNVFVLFRTSHSDTAHAFVWRCLYRWIVFISETHVNLIKHV